jgi:hypothetical protein
MQKVLRPANLIKVFCGFLGSRANAELVPKFHIALHASHAALPVVTLTLGWITLLMGDMGEGTLHREERNCQTKKVKSGRGPSTKTNWPTEWQYNLKLNLHHCTANYRHFNKPATV